MLLIGMTTIASTRLVNKERVKDCLNKIATSSRHLLGLINDVLDMSKIENGKFTINKEPVCLSDFMHDFISIIQPQVKAKHLELDLSILGIEDEIVHYRFSAPSPDHAKYYEQRYQVYQREWEKLVYVWSRPLMTVKGTLFMYSVLATMVLV